MPDEPTNPLPLPLKAVGGEIFGAGSFLVARVTSGPGGTSVASEHDRSKARAQAIVAACNAHPGLRARVAALEAENARLRGAVVHGINHLDAAATVADDKIFVKWARQLANEMRAKMETADV